MAGRSSESSKMTAELLTRIALLDSRAGAAHERLDKMERLIKDDLTSMHADFKETILDLKKLFAAQDQELKNVVAWMNRGKGWAAAGFLAASILGGVIAKALLK